MSECQIHFPTKEEEDAELKSFFKRQRIIRDERRAACELAKRSLPVLIECCKGKTGQSYKIRSLLFSLWNGQPAKLIQVVNLDWELQRAFSHIVMAFGFDDFFYDAIREAFELAGLFEWFCEEGEQ